MFNLPDLGWQPFFERQLDSESEGVLPGRVAEEMKGAYRVFTEAGDLLCGLPGRLLHAASGRGDFPAVGDWVAVQRWPGEPRGTIVRLLDRRTKLARQMAGERIGEQLLAANIDLVFLVTSLNQELNVRRIERYLTMIWESGARPVIVLNKADLCTDPNPLRRRVETVAPGVEVHVTSAAEREGTGAIEIARGETAVFVGSSGVGKSSLINCLAGAEVQTVHAIREDDARGRHTTTSRQMLLLPGGGIVIDTPGLRELQLWQGEGEALGRTFADVEALAAGCAFTDCRHEAEPGCGVTSAIDDGRLDGGRYRSYQKLQRELTFAARKQDAAFQIEQKKKWKQIHKANRQRIRMRGR